MKIAVIGTGYVGLVTGTCLAESGNDVLCVDKVASKIEGLKAGKVPIYEPGLSELVARSARDGRLRFTTSLTEGIAEAEIIFIAVGTPQGGRRARGLLSGVWAVEGEIAQAMEGPQNHRHQSTRARRHQRRAPTRLMAEVASVPFDVANNPEFLKEVAAIDDFNKPDRVVVGGAQARKIGEQPRLAALRPVPGAHRPAVPGHDARKGGEMTKYVWRTACSPPRSASSTRWRTSARRMGPTSTRCAGGSATTSGSASASSSRASATAAVSFRKTSARRRSTWPVLRGLAARMMEAVDAVNEAQKDVLGRKIVEHFRGDVQGKTIARSGARRFKPRTDDVRGHPGGSF